MSEGVFWAAAAAILLPLLLVALVDFVALWRALHRPVEALVGIVPVFDFEVLVPIYGSISYLENVDFLHRYGDRVVLCTTRGESVEFYRQLREMMDRHSFRVFVGDTDRTATAGRRATGGVVRDRLIRDALGEVHATYVLCIDADTVTSEPLETLVGAIAAQSFDVASIRLVPSNRTTLLARLQCHEYRIAMDLRRIMPWLVSGACHGGRTEAMREVMSRHSLFFQGNDVETGILADSLGLKVGHVPVEVPTTVPERFGPWWRQRLAWAGGGVRLFAANPQLALRHPFLWAYGLVICLVMVPLRWASVAPSGWRLLLLAGIYLLVCALVYRGSWDVALLAMPLYAGLTSLILVPLGFLWYLKMVRDDRNFGLIRPGRRPTRSAPAGSSRTPPRQRVELAR